jgi:ATP/maltotriose-dependent transcriptional regulator MalT
MGDFSGEADALRWVAKEWPNLLALVRLAHDNSMDETPAIARVLSLVLGRRDSLVAQHENASLGLSSAERVEDSEAEAYFLADLACCELRLGNVGEAESLIERWFSVVAQGDGKLGDAMTLIRCSQACEQAGRVVEADDLLARAEPVAKSIAESMVKAEGATGNGSGIELLAELAAARGCLDTRRGEFASALRHHKRAMRMWRRVGGSSGIVAGHMNLAELDAARGWINRAVERTDEAVRLASIRDIRPNVEMRVMGKAMLIYSRARKLEKVLATADRIVVLYGVTRDLEAVVGALILKCKVLHLLGRARDADDCRTMMDTMLAESDGETAATLREVISNEPLLAFIAHERESASRPESQA